LCVIAPAGVEVGCDLETVEPRIPAFLTDYFTDEERNLVSRTPAASRDRLVTLLWSAKESALKALRCGLRLDTRSVRAAPSDVLEARDDGWHPVSATHTSGRTFYGWWRDSGDLVRTVVTEFTSAVGPGKAATERLERSPGGLAVVNREIIDTDSRADEAAAAVGEDRRPSG
jgi:4'-phosphopantetheinyl transferase